MGERQWRCLDGGENDASGESGYHFEGNIDEVRVHSGALTAADIDVLRTETHSCQLTCFNDDFNRTALGSDWAVSSRYGSFGFRALSTIACA